MKAIRTYIIHAHKYNLLLLLQIKYEYIYFIFVSLLEELDIQLLLFAITFRFLFCYMIWIDFMIEYQLTYPQIHCPKNVFCGDQQCVALIKF